MIILLKNVTVRVKIHFKTNQVNKNIDIVLENPTESTIEIKYYLSESDSSKIKMVRLNKNKPIDYIIELNKPFIRRSIQKVNLIILNLQYVICIKRIFKITAFYEEGARVIADFPNIKLLAKLLVEDGTNEAISYFYDQAVVNTFKIDKDNLEKIYNLSRISTSVVVFEKFTNINILTGNNIEDISNSLFYLWCIPFSNVVSLINFNLKQAKKSIYDNPYDKYFENLTNNKNNKNKAFNLVFINGDVVIEKIFDEDTLTSRPYLKAIHVELI